MKNDFTVVAFIYLPIFSSWYFICHLVCSWKNYTSQSINQKNWASTKTVLVLNFIHGRTSVLLEIKECQPETDFWKIVPLIICIKSFHYNCKRLLNSWSHFWNLEFSRRLNRFPCLLISLPKTPIVSRGFWKLIAWTFVSFQHNGKCC